MSSSIPDSQIVNFPDWKRCLSHAGLTDRDHEAYRRAILSFLSFCKKRHSPASVAVFRLYLEDAPQHRSALRWFFQAARQAEGRFEVSQAGSPEKEGDFNRQKRGIVPPLGKRDLGGADWERDLIKAIREAGLLWRTEETYRGWAQRFVRYIAPGSPYAATNGWLLPRKDRR